jgi:hypothetical protein
MENSRMADNGSKCIVCNTPHVTSQPTGRGGGEVLYDCPRCGRFVLTGSTQVQLEHELGAVPIRRALMSHVLRRMQRPNDEHLRPITTYDLESFWRDGRLPTPQQQADSLILWIGDNQFSPEDSAEAHPLAIAAWIGAMGEPGLTWLIPQLKEKRLFELLPGGSPAKWRCRLTMEGWERYAALKKTNIDSRTAFMAMKFGEPDLDVVFQDCFRPAVQRTGFELRRVIDRQPAGIIDDQMRAAILASRFVISDLTHGSAGAYWEAGFGEGLGLPVIYTCEKGAWEEQQTHFDTNHLVTIFWDIGDLKKAADALAATIRATLRSEAKQTDN